MSFCKLVSDFLFPDHLNKKILEQGILQNFEIEYELDYPEKQNKWEIDIHEFIRFLQIQYPFMRSSLKYQFDMYINSSQMIQLPKYTKSHILNEEYMRMLLLLNSKFHSQLELKLLYSTKVNGQSFNKLIDQINGWPAPAMFLLKTSYKNLKKEIIECVIGVMTFCELQDHQFYYGDSNTFLFSITPVLKKLIAKQGKKKENYIYINSESNKNM